MTNFSETSGTAKVSEIVLKKEAEKKGKHVEPPRNLLKEIYIEYEQFLNQKPGLSF